MSYAIATNGNVPRITQSGTDTALAGIDTMASALAAIAALTPYVVGDIHKPPAQNGAWYRCTTAGTTAGAAPLYNPVSGSTTTDGTAVFTAFLAPLSYPNGSLRTYIFPEVDFEITGTLTIANPQFQTYTCRRLHTSNTCIYTSGSFMSDGVTPKFHGVHFTTTMKGANDYQEVSNWNGVWAIRGGMYQIAASIAPLGTGLQTFHAVTVVSSADWARSIRWRAYNTQTRYLNGCSFYNAAFDAFNVPITLNAKGYASEYVSEYVGAAAGGTDSKMEVFALSNQDGQFDFDNYGGGWVELYNCAKGAAIEMRNLGNDARHCVPLFQQINFTVTNLQGAVQNDVRYTTTDAPTSSPTVTITTASSLKTWDFRNPITLTGITAGGGLVSSLPVLKVWHGVTNIQNLRYPSSIATYFFCGYAVRKFSKAVILGADTAQNIGIAGESATNLTLTEAQAAALTGIAMAPSGQTTGTTTVTVARTTMELWQYFRQWIGLNYATRDDTWLPSSGILSLGAWNLTSTLVISAASGFNEIATTGIISSTLTSGGAYTYSNGSLVLPLTLPTLTAGTMNIGAAATFAFATAGTIVSMTPTAPSTYIFTGAHTGTLDLRNAAAHAITVQVPLGTTTTTASNVGGVITVTNPAITGTATVTGAVANSRILIRNVTASTTVSNAIGTGYSNVYVEGTDFTTGQTYSVTVTHVDKLEIIYNGTVSASGFTVTVAQLADDVYVSKGFDGSTFTGINFNTGTIDLDLDGGVDPVVLWGETYARYKYQTTLVGGITTLIGAMFAKDLANFLFSNAIVFNNLSATPVQIGGDGFGSRRDGLSMFGSGSIRIDNSTSVLIANAADVTAIKAKTDLLPADPASNTVVNTRLATSSYVAPNNAGIAAIPTNPLLTTDVRLNALDANISTRLASASYTVPPTVVAMRTEIDANSTRLATSAAQETAIKAKTDLIPAIPASSTNITAGTITTVTNLTNAATAGDLTATMKASVTAAVPTVAAIRTEMDTNSTRLDAAVSTRLSTAGYTAPNNAGIAAIPTNPLLTTDVRLNTLDVAVSTRLASAAYTVPPTTVAIRSEIDANSTKLTVPTSSLETTANANANAAALPANVWAVTSEAGQAYGKQLRDMRATLLGTTTGAGTTSEAFRAADGATVRVTSTNDGTNRTNVAVPGG